MKWIEKILSYNILQKRNRWNYLSNTERERIANFISLLYGKSLESMYIGGSQSRNCTFKYPTKMSDVDVYVFLKNSSQVPWIKNADNSLYATKCLGHGIEVFEIAIKYKQEVTKGMEQIYGINN
jgi:hypothetical protein